MDIDRANEIEISCVRKHLGPLNNFIHIYKINENNNHFSY